MTLLRLFRDEGEKVIYRLCYAIVSMAIYIFPGKKTQEEFVKSYKGFQKE